MKKSMSLALVLIVLFFASNLYSQEKPGEVGKILTAKEALELFGKVEKSVSIPVATFKEYVAKADKYVMFTIKNDKAVVTNEKRILLTDDKALSISAEEPMHLYSKSKVDELISLGKSEMVQLEIRGDYFTISSGAVTLEYCILCPPICL